MPKIKEIYVEWKKSLNYNTFTYGELTDLTDCQNDTEMLMAVKATMDRVKDTVDKQLDVYRLELVEVQKANKAPTAYKGGNFDTPKQVATGQAKMEFKF